MAMWKDRQFVNGFDEEGGFRFSPVDAASAGRRGQHVVGWAKREFSDRRYAGTGRTLSVRWWPATRFGARARIMDAEPQAHIIDITEGVALALHDDAENLVAFCNRVLVRPAYDVIYALLGDRGRSWFPFRSEPDLAIDRMFRLTMAWLFLHEQAHLFQNHHDLSRRFGGGDAAASGVIEEFAAGSPATIVTGRKAAVSHVFELSADHEATALAMQLMLLADEMRLLPGTLWLFVAGLMCMFQRFFDEDRRLEGEAASGTHPLPSYRMHLAQRAMLAFVAHPRVMTYAPGLRDASQVQRLLDHAMVTSAIYWNSRYRQGRRVDDFLNGASAIERVPEPYRRQLHETWGEIRPYVVATHQGWGADTVLDIPSPFAI